MEVSLRLVTPQAKRAEILDVLRTLKGPTEFSKGCRGCCILQDTEDENVLTYLAKWETEDDLTAHLRSERFRRLLPYIEMSTETPEVEIDLVDRIGGLEYLVAMLSASPE